MNDDRFGKVDPIGPPGAGPIVALVVDDHQRFRRVAADVVRATPGLRLGGVASNGEDALVLQRSAGAHLVLMDINMPGMGGIEACRRLTEHDPEIVVLLLSTCDPDRLPLEAELSGAIAYIHKDHLGPDELIWVCRRRWENRPPAAADPVEEDVTLSVSSRWILLLAPRSSPTAIDADELSGRASSNPPAAEQHPPGTTLCEHLAGRNSPPRLVMPATPLRRRTW
jgi:two-component system, NarL family, invasion response regulator UvrY